MESKKIILKSFCAITLLAFIGCSDNGDNSVTPEVPISSGELIPESSSDLVPTSSSNVIDPGISSSSIIADTDEPQMACSEIMYHAPDGSELEWIEIYIAGGMDMASMAEFDMHLSGAVDYYFPAEPLKKGEYIVVANNLDLFRSEYPDFTGRLFGPWDNPTKAKLVNEGDVVNVKIRGEGDVSCAFGNEPPWPSLADGKGRTIVYKGGNAAQPNSWGASKINKGNPGVGKDEWVNPAKVRINEIMPNATGVNAWVELYNTGDESVDVAGWTLTVKRRNQVLKIKSGAVSTVIPPKGYVVLDAIDNFENNDPESTMSGELIVSNQGGEFYLRGFNEGEESSIWIPASLGSSGILDLKDGSTAQGPLTTPTPGASNSPLKLGSVFINEIHYHPLENGDDINFEFMEIVNNTDEEIVLKTSNANFTKGWKIEGINIEFEAVKFPAHSLMVLLPDTSIVVGDTAYIRTQYGIPSDVQFAIYHGKLSNRGETIAIKEPYAKEGSGINEKYYYIWHDATLYSDAWPGLVEADGAGYSLQRVDKTTMGFEASAWIAAKPSIGKL